MTGGEPRSDVVLVPGSERSAADAGLLLAHHLGLHPADATGRARYGGGILATGMARADAERAASELSRAGIAARAVDQEILSGLPRVRRARSLRFAGDALFAGLAGTGEVRLARSSVAGVHLHALPGKPPTEEAKPPAGIAGRLRSLPGIRGLAGRPRALGREERAEGRDAAWFLQHHHDIGEDLALTQRAKRLRDSLAEAGDPPPRLLFTVLPRGGEGPLRLEADDMDHVHLGEEKAAHSLDNFLLTLERLQAFAPGAWMAERTASFLERLDPSDVLYFKPEEPQNLERWMQLWIRIREMEAP